MPDRVNADTPDDLLLTLFRHGRWANRLLLERASALSPEELRTPIGAGAFADLLGTLLHVYDVEESWLDRIRNGTSGPSLSVDDYPDIATLGAAWKALDEDLERFITGLSVEDLDRVASYRSQGGSTGAFPVRIMLSNVFFHSQQHRGEIAMALTAHGRSPGDLGLIHFLKQNPAYQPPDRLP